VTDAAEMASKPDAPVVACLSVPVRYTHAPIELLALDDLSALVELSEHVLRTLPRDPSVFGSPW